VSCCLHGSEQPLAAASLNGLGLGTSGANSAAVASTKMTALNSSEHTSMILLHLPIL
jgi:hypothetical protein